VAYAIDRDTLVDVVMNGLADKLDGPVGKGQYAWDPDTKPRFTYDPAKARELVKQAGFPNGVTVEFNTTVNRYTNDKQTSEAIVAMLKQVGITAQMKTPEWSRLSADINVGKIAFYYYGRGSVDDPSPMLSQYFETGVTERLGYSNPELDKMLVEERATFDPEKRKALLRKAMALVTDDAPAHFLWRMKLIYGLSSAIDFEPDGSAGIYGPDIKMKRN
jgi:peptide/nickel transport system substrate-binding protein